MVKRRPWWFWLSTSLLGVLAAIVFAAGILTLWEAWFKHRDVVERRQETAFRNEPLHDPPYLPYLARLPAPSTLGTNGLRFVAKPELEDVTYAAAFRSAGPNDPVAITLSIVRERPQAAATHVQSTCQLSPSSYRALTIAIDERTQGFNGDDQFGTDGTSLGFERIRGSRLSSGGGNFIEPYRGLGEIVLARLREACPRAPLPEVGDDWYHRDF